LESDAAEHGIANLQRVPADFVDKQIAREDSVLQARTG